MIEKIKKVVSKEMKSREKEDPKGSPGMDSSILDQARNKMDYADMLTKSYNQNKPTELLVSEIMAGLKLSKKDATKGAHTVCKTLNLWIELNVKGFYKESFASFLAFLFNKGWVDPFDLSLDALQKDIIKAINPNLKLIEVNTFRAFQGFRETEFWLGTLRIKVDKKDGKHSMFCYNDIIAKKIELSDTSYRGQRVDYKPYVNETNFDYLTIIEEGVA